MKFTFASMPFTRLDAFVTIVTVLAASAAQEAG
jgi:hypothetical protein